MKNSEDNTNPSINVENINYIMGNYDFLKREFIGKALEAEYRNAAEAATPADFIQNDTCLHALLLSEIMFDRTENSIRIFSGSNVAKFLSTIKDSFRKACENIVSHNGKVRIITTVSHKNAANTRTELKAFADGIRKGIKDKFQREIDLWCACYRADAKELAALPHYIACDSKMLRLEAAHAPLTGKENAGVIKANVYFNSPRTTEKFEAYFDKIYNNITGR